MDPQTKSRTIPPSRFQRTLADEAAKTLTILSATSTGVQLGPNTPYNSEIKGYPGGVSIYSEKVVLRVSGRREDVAPTFSSPSGPLSISCSDAEVLTPGAPALISTQGSDGKSEAQHQGGAANDVLLYVGNLSQATVKNIKFTAQGGKGANVSAKEKTGGNGGNGGTILVTGRYSLAKLHTLLTAFQKKYRLPENWTDAAEQKADSFADDHFLVVDLANTLKQVHALLPGQQAELAPLLAPINSLLSLSISKGEAPLNPDGFPARSVYSICAAINETLSNLEESLDQLRLLILQRCTVDGGAAGKAENKDLVQGLLGKDGLKGNLSVDILGPLCKKTPREVPFAYAHPLQCSMLLDKATMYFYFANAANRNIAQRLLAGLIDRLSFATPAFVTACETGDFSLPLLRAYYSLCGSAYDKTVTCVRSLKATYNKAANMYVQLTATNVDYYGMTSEWVPRMNYEAFKEAIDVALDELQRTEDAYMAYLNESEKKDKLDKYTSVASDRLTATASAVEEEIADLKARLSVKYALLTDTKKKDAILAAKSSSEDAMGFLKDEITAKIGLSPKSLLQGFINLAGGPSTALAAAQGASLAYEAFTTVPNSSGDPVPKSLLVKSITKGSTTVGGLKEDMLAVKGSSDGSLDLNTEFSSKIMVETRILDALLDEFDDDTFGTRGKDAKTKLKAFSALMIARNSDLVDYNLILKTLLSRRDEASSLRDRETQLQKNRLNNETNTAEDLDNMTKLLESIYDTNRARVMKLLQFLQRALRYKTLTTTDFINAAFTEQARSQGTTDEAALSMTTPVLRSIRTRLADHLFDTTEKAGSDRQLFPSNFETGGIGRLHRLSSSELSTLLQVGQVTVRIPAVDAFADTTTEKASEFRGWADVRIYRVRFWFSGLKVRTETDQSTASVGNGTSGSANGKGKEHQLSRRFVQSKPVTVKLTHSGYETFFNSDDEEYRFQHDPIKVTFSYRLHGDGSFDIADSASGDIVNFSSATRGVNSVYAAPSPFADWTISLMDLDVDSFDFSNVESGALEFFGSYRSFHKG